MVKEGSPAVQEFGVIDVTAGTGLAPSTSADFFLQALKEKNKSFISFANELKSFYPDSNYKIIYFEYL